MATACGDFQFARALDFSSWPKISASVRTTSLASLADEATGRGSRGEFGVV